MTGDSGAALLFIGVAALIVAVAVLLWRFGGRGMRDKLPGAGRNDSGAGIGLWGRSDHDGDGGGSEGGGE